MLKKNSILGLQLLSQFLRGYIDVVFAYELKALKESSKTLNHSNTFNAFLPQKHAYMPS